MWNLKRNRTNEFTKQKWTHRLREGVYGCAGWLGGKWGEERVKEFGMDMCTLLYLKQVTSNDLLYSTWNSAQSYVAEWMGGELGGRMDTCICMAESLHCSPETITTLSVNQPYPSIR